MRAYVCMFVFPRVSFFSARNIVYLHTPFAPYPFLLSLNRSLSFSFSFFSSSHSVPEEERIAVPGSRVDRVRKRVSDG